MKFLRLLGVFLMLFFISMKADAGIKVQARGSQKFELVKEFKVTMPMYGKDTRGGRTGRDEKSGVIFNESSYLLREYIYPKNTVVAGEVFTVRLYRVVAIIDQDIFEGFLYEQNTNLIGLQTAMFKKEQDVETDVPMRRLSEKAVLWKNSEKDKGIPLMACGVDEDMWFLYAGLDFDFSGTTEFLVFTKDY